MLATSRATCTYKQTTHYSQHMHTHTGAVVRSGGGIPIQFLPTVRSSRQGHTSVHMHAQSTELFVFQMILITENLVSPLEERDGRLVDARRGLKRCTINVSSLLIIIFGSFVLCFYHTSPVVQFSIYRLPDSKATPVNYDSNKSYESNTSKL